MTVMGKRQRCFSPSENLPHLRAGGPSPAPAGQPVPAPARLPGAHSPRQPRLKPRPAARRCDPRAAPSVSTAHPGARPAPAASLPAPPLPARPPRGRGNQRPGHLGRRPPNRRPRGGSARPRRPISGRGGPWHRPRRLAPGRSALKGGRGSSLPPRASFPG